MTSPFPADYTTLTEVRLLKNIPADKDGDDNKLRRFIRQASRLIDDWTTRHFVPYVFTERFSRDYLRNLYDLRMGRDLLELTTLTNADGTAIAGDSYLLLPDNSHPKRTISLKSAGGASWSFANREDRVQVAGIWGYHDYYPAAWGNSLDTVQNNPLLVGGTSLVVGSATGLDDRGMTRFEVGDYLKFGATNDFAQIAAISSNTLTIARGVNGSTAAQHIQGTPIYVYRQLDDVRFMANEVVKWLYEHRQTINSGVQLAQNLGVVIVRELPEIKALAETFVPRTSFEAV